MAFTIATLVEDGMYITRLLQRDYNGDEVKKVNRLLNLLDIHTADESSLELFWQAYEAVTTAGMPVATVSQEVAVTGQNTAPGTPGLYSKISDRMVLWFTKAHPLNPAKPIWAKFIVVAPHVDIVGTGVNAGRPNFTEGSSLLDAAVPETYLGAMIQYLESAITYKAVDDNYYNGGWDYVHAESQVVSVPRAVGGNPID